MADDHELGLELWQGRLSKMSVLITALGPVGSVIGGTLGGMLADVRFRRLEESAQSLVAKLDGVTPVERYVRSEDFHDIVAETIEAVTREHYAEKRAALVNYLSKAATDQIDYDAHVQLRVIATMRELSRAELSLLAWLNELQRPPTEFGIDVPFSAIHSKTGLTRDQFDDMARHLDRMGLAKVRATLARVDVDGRSPTAGRISITDQGARFLSAIEE